VNGNGKHHSVPYAGNCGGPGDSPTNGALYDIATITAKWPITWAQRAKAQQK
jgi:hypothetical protein